MTGREHKLTRATLSLRRALVQSLVQFRSNPLRTFLTLLGIVFGVASVVAMLAIGEGAQREILASIETMGADVVHIKATPVAKDKVGAIVNKSRGLCPADLQDLKQLLPPLRGAAFRARIEVGVTDVPGVDATTLPLLAVSEGYFDLHRLRPGRGRGLVRHDHHYSQRVAVLGERLARRAFPNGVVGKRVRLNYTYFEVVGVLAGAVLGAASKDLPVDPSVHRDAVLIPFSSANEALRPTPTYAPMELLSLKVANTEATLAAKRLIEPVLRQLHGGQRDVQVVAPEELLRQKEATQSVLNIVLLSIAAISLLVGGIGVMNIMLANIMERIPEIGLRRAVGARRADIRNQFLLEAVLICAFGGVLGVMLGFAISFGVAFFSGMAVAFPWHAAFLSLSISALVGVTFGLMPALRASNINPIEALQHG
ncbi:MAG: ABC transporter permease [Deltaproteobacteria bacterium]|nr:ABC transporter permease [Deltaproteobacteria bacterium]